MPSATNYVGRNRGRAGMVPVLVAVALLAAACGAGPETDNRAVAALPDPVEAPDSGTKTDEPAASSEADASELSPEEAQLAYSQCMADNDVEDPFAGSGGESVDGESATSPGVVAFDSEEDFAAFEAALEECSSILEDAFGEFDLSPEQEAAAKDAQAAFSQCMTEQGFSLNEDEGSSFVVEGDDVESIDAAFAECNSAFDELGGLEIITDQEEG